MKKTLKSKVMAGTITVALLSSAGFALANTDAGTAFKDWYAGAFGSSQDHVLNETGKYGYKIIDDANKYTTGLKATATTEIANSKDTKVKNATTSINKAKDEQIKSIDETKKDIEKNMQKQFDVLYADTVKMIDSAAAGAYSQAAEDLGKHVSTEGGNAVADMKTKIEGVKTQAVKDLEAAIKKAKGDIEKELDSKERKTVGDLTRYIDAKYFNLKKEADRLVAQLIKAQEVILAENAAAFERDALAALDDVVAGINK